MVWDNFILITAYRLYVSSSFILKDSVTHFSVTIFNNISSIERFINSFSSVLYNLYFWTFSTPSNSNYWVNFLLVSSPVFRSWFFKKITIATLPCFLSESSTLSSQCWKCAHHFNYNLLLPLNLYTFLVFIEYGSLVKCLMEWARSSARRPLAIYLTHIGTFILLIDSPCRTLLDLVGSQFCSTPLHPLSTGINGVSYLITYRFHQ